MPTTTAIAASFPALLARGRPPRAGHCRLGAAFMGMVMVGCSQQAEPERRAPPSPASSQSSALAASSAPTLVAASASASARPAGSADTADLEAKLAADQAYAGIWEAPRRKDLELLLTAVSQHLTHGGLVGQAIGAVRAARLDQAAATLDLIQLRAGQYPDDFTKRFNAHLDSTKGEPRLGTWSEPIAGQPPHDYAALAVWHRAPRRDVHYMRELLAARRLGPARWVVPSRTRAKRFLTVERDAIAQIEKVTELGLSERARFDEIGMAGPLVKLPLERLANDLVKDKLREEPRILGKVAEVAGVVAEIGKDRTTIMLAPTKPKEAARAQCSFDELAAAKLAGLSKGAAVTVQARVDALDGHVVLGSCEIAIEAKAR